MTAPTVLFEITRQCDRSCRYCYNRDRRPPLARDLTPGRIEDLLDRLCTGSKPAITIIGGEPLTVAELADVARRLSRRGLRVSLSTNALTLHRERIEELVAAGVGSFEVSLDTPDPGTFEALTGSSGVERVRQAVTELLRSSADVMVGAMLTRENASQLGDLLSLCFALGVRRVGLNQLAPVGGARSQVASLALSDVELDELLQLADVRAAELGMSIGIGLPVEPCRIRRERFPHLQFEACCCGLDKWLVEPSGAVRTCELADLVVGNLFESTLDELSRTAAVAAFREQTLTPECDGCSDWSLCRGGCRFRG